MALGILYPKDFKGFCLQKDRMRKQLGEIGMFSFVLDKIFSPLWELSNLISDRKRKIFSACAKQSLVQENSFIVPSLEFAIISTQTWNMVDELQFWKGCLSQRMMTELAGLDHDHSKIGQTFCQILEKFPTRFMAAFKVQRINIIHWSWCNGDSF